MSGQAPYMSAPQYGYPTGFQQRDARYPGGTNVETTMGINRRPSLLAGYHNPFTSPDRTSMPPYLFSLAPPVSMGPHVDEHSKRSRHSAGIPLSIDVKKEQPVYQPQTEAISPIFDEAKVDSHMRDTTIIRNSISKLESDIEITKKKLDRAKLSQSEIKSQADRSAADEEENEDQDTLFNTNGSQTLIDKIFHDNRKKAEDGQKVLNQLNNNMDLTIPLYQEPNDLESIAKIRTQYMHVMKNRLINLLKKSRERYMCRTKFESENYDQSYQQWQKSIEKEEKAILANDATAYRDTFEKTFPELRKAREDKEKKQSTQNINDSSSSSSEQQQITSNVNSIEQENEEETNEKMRKSSVIPPIMYDSWQRKHQYFNQNGLVKGDATVFYKEHTKMPYWSPEEKQIFIDKFTQSPKNFGYISSFLENKTTEQCVQFYYMTKKTENYKNLLRKQTQNNKRKTKQNTTTTVTSSTTIETTLVTKVTSNTIISSTSQQLIPSEQDIDRSTDRIDNDDERRDKDSGDNNEEKRSNKNRCQLLSCTTDKGGKKKNRKNRLRAFPAKWNELSNEDQEEIRLVLQIPQNVQRCCTRCYDKLISEIRQRKKNRTLEEEEDDDDNDQSTMIVHQKEDEEEWDKAEIDAFTQALNRYNHDWPQIAQYCHRSVESCRTFYMKHFKNLSPIEQNIDEDNGSISDSETGQTKQTNDDNQLKTINEDSNDSAHAMVIDEVEEQLSNIEEKPSKPAPSKPTLSVAHLMTITSLVEKEISKTLSETDNRSLSNNTNATTTKTNNNNNNNKDTNSSPERPVHNNNHPVQPPPLITVAKSRSPTAYYPFASHPQQQQPPPLPPVPIPVPVPVPSQQQQKFVNKGSIMRGTPIASATPTNKPIAIDGPPVHPHSHHYNGSRNEYSHLKTPKMLDRSIEQQQHLLQQQQHLIQQQQQQQQQQKQHAAQMRHYGHSQQYLPQQQPPQHKTPGNKIDTSNTDTFETLRADYVTSKYLTTTHSPSHERQHRGISDQVSPSQISPPMGQILLPPPTAINGPNSNQPMPSSQHHHSQQAALLTASQLLASSVVYPQDMLQNNLLPYGSYYGSSAANPQFLFDPRLMHDYATVAANNEQMKAEHHKAAMRLSRHHHPPSLRGHSPSDQNYAVQSSKRHSHDTGYPTNDYPASMWHAQNMNNAQAQQMKLHSAASENPLLKLNELSRYSSRVPERNTRSPDDYHHHVNSSRVTAESPSMHFQRVDAHNHRKLSHDKSNPNLNYPDHSTDVNSLNYLRQPPNVHKPQTTHHSPHRDHHHGTNFSNRTLAPPMQNSQISPHHSAYLMHGHHHNPNDTKSPQRQQQQSPHHHQPHYSQPSQPRTTDHNDLSISSTKESISIQEFINKNVNDFVSSTNNDNKNSANDATPYETHNSQSTRVRQTSNSDQLILIDGDDDSNPVEQSDSTNKSNTEGGMFERRRDSSIKKILSNQPLEKPEYVEINQKVQNSSVGASKVHSNTDQTGIERSNTIGERTRSRGSITMRMLMGANDIYADGKAQPVSTIENQSTKRSASPKTDKCEKIEYLIRDALDRECPTLIKRDGAMSIFQKSSPTQPPPQQQQQQQSSSKRLRLTPKDDEQRHSSFSPKHESPNTIRDPFALQPQSKNQHHQLTSTSNSEKNWQTYAQQQYHLSNPYSTQSSSRSSRPPGSITQGSPISSSLRLLNDQQQYSSATNNQLVNPRYSYYSNDQQILPSGQPSTSPIDNSPKGKILRRPAQTYSSSPEVQHGSTSNDHSSILKSSSTNPTSLTDTNTGNTPPIATSPPASISLNSAHPLKKRLINEYELEQQRNSPIIPQPPPSTTTSIERVETTDERKNTPNVDIPKTNSENMSNTEVNDETARKSTEETDNST